MFVKTCLGLVCLVSFALAACSGVDAPESSDEASVDQLSSALQPGDTTNQVVFPNSDSVIKCDMHDGFTSYTAGQCEIFVEQKCELIDEKCHCKVKVLDTAGPCANKDWKDFYPTP